MTIDPNQQPNHIGFKPEPVNLPFDYDENLDREMMLDFLAMNVFRLDEEDGIGCLLYTAHRQAEMDDALAAELFATKNIDFTTSKATTSVEWIEQLITRRAELPGTFVTAIPSAPNKEVTEMLPIVTTKFESFDELIATVKGCLEAQERVYLHSIVTCPDNKPMLRWAHYL